MAPKPLQRAWDIFSGTATLWGVLPSAWQGAAITAVSAVTAFFGFQSGGFFYAFLGAGAMFLFTTAGLYYAILLNRQTSIFQRLTVEPFGVVQAGIQGDKEKKQFFIRGLTLEGNLRSHSEREMWIKLERAYHSISNITAEGEISKMVSVIPPHGQLKFNLATLPDIPLPSDGSIGPTGSIDLEILYGPKRDDLRYVLYYVCKPAVGVHIDIEKGQGAISITFPITRHEHERHS